MSVLTGLYNHMIDEKNRIRIPAKLKANMLGITEDDEKDKKKSFSLVFHTGTDGSIGVYTQEAVDILFEKYKNIKQSDPEIKYVRQFTRTFETVDSDPQGRLVIPSTFKAHAKIKKDIVICGVIDHIEIWAAEVYEEYIGKQIMSIDEINDISKKLSF